LGCHVISFEGLTVGGNLRDTLRNEWRLFGTPKRSNSTFRMSLVHEMDIDYLVVDETINIKIVWLQLHA
jgi:hypothetical protein